MKRLNDLPKVTKLVSGESGIQPRESDLRSPRSFGDTDSAYDLLSQWFSTLAAH